MEFTYIVYKDMISAIKAALNNKLVIAGVCDIFPECMESLLLKHGLEKDAN